MFFLPVSKWWRNSLRNTRTVCSARRSDSNDCLSDLAWRSNMNQLREKARLGLVRAQLSPGQGAPSGLRDVVERCRDRDFPRPPLRRLSLGMLVVLCFATRPSQGARRGRLTDHWTTPRSHLRFDLCAPPVSLHCRSTSATLGDHRFSPLAYGQIIPATDTATIARINVAREASGEGG